MKIAILQTNFNRTYCRTPNLHLTKNGDVQCTRFSGMVRPPRGVPGAEADKLEAYVGVCPPPDDVVEANIAGMTNSVATIGSEDDVAPVSDVDIDVVVPAAIGPPGLRGSITSSPSLLVIM